MFTGIVTALGTVRDITPLSGDADMRLEITAPWSDTAAIPIGASIGCSGCCLTAIEVGAGLVRRGSLGRDPEQDHDGTLEGRDTAEPRTLAVCR